MTELSPERQEEILRELGDLLTGGLRPGWGQVTLTWSAVVSGGAETSLRVTDAEGRDRGDDIPDGIGRLCGRLKDGMYRPGAGTWFTMTFVLAADGSYKAGFDYDGEPERAGFVPEHYAKEVARFPRDPEHTPAWLEEILARVPNFYAGIHGEPGERYADAIGPHPGEVARAFDDAGWQVGPGEYNGEFTFTTDWASLTTLSHYGLVRMAGKIDPDRWTDLVAFLTEQGWNFGASLYEGDDIVANVDPRPTD